MIKWYLFTALVLFYFCINSKDLWPLFFFQQWLVFSCLFMKFYNYSIIYSFFVKYDSIVIFTTGTVHDYEMIVISLNSDMPCGAAALTAQVFLSCPGWPLRPYHHFKVAITCQWSHEYIVIVLCPHSNVSISDHYYAPKKDHKKAGCQ